MDREQYRFVLDELVRIADQAIHIISDDGVTVFYNQAMADLEKINVEDALGKSFREVFSHIPANESTLYRALLKGEPTINLQQTYLNKYGREVTTVNSTVPVKVDGKIVAAIEIAKDITNVRRMSTALLDLQADLRKAASKSQSKDIRGIKKYSFADIVGTSPAFGETLDIARKAAKTDASVFIYGDTGTGKELIAQSIHYESDRRDKPFLAQNCAALPEALLEGILFGTDKGGFTGALDRTGLFEQADGGTLLLDEISALDYDLQSKLLRVLQEEYIRRVGGTKDIPVNVRIIATSNEEPETLIRENKLRKDLFYRLNIVNIRIPSLDERDGDISVLARAFLEKHNKRLGKNVVMLSEHALQALEKHEYPGNVRELENIILAALSLAGNENVLTEKHIRPFMGNKPSGLHDRRFVPGEMGLNDYLAQRESAIIEQVMAQCDGNISKTAQLLGIKRQTLQHKLKKIDIKI